MAVSGNWQCTVDTGNGVILRVRNAPSLAGAIIGSIPDGTSGLHATREENGWYFIDSTGGWSSGDWMHVSGSADAAVVEPTKSEVTTPQKPTLTVEQQVEAYMTFDSEFNATPASDLITKNLNGIYGIPYQFMSSVDRRVDGTSIGRTYADRIVSRMPLLLLSPGKVNFMRDYKDKVEAAQTIMHIIDSAVPTDLNDSVSGVGRYYTFDFDYVNYYGCVNQMISSGSRFLDLHNTKVNIGGKIQKLSDVNWAEAGNDGFKGILSKKEYVAFYIDSSNQIQESFSNQTTESQLSSTVNSFSDIGREISFLLGATTGDKPRAFDQDAIDSTLSKIDDISKNYLNNNQLLTDIGKQFATVAVGGKLIFPEIWADSTFSKSYNINIKLRTPDGDRLSWFMNIYVPLCHLICLTAPQQSSAGVNGYVSPFLVRGFYRGLFNCDMGIITDLNISKGKEGAWTIDKLPTEVDIDMTLKDLYTMMSITKENNPGAFVNNLCLVDYIANTCGININEPDFIRQVDLYLILKMNKFKHIIPNVWSSVEQEFSNKMQTWYHKASNIFLR